MKALIRMPMVALGSMGVLLAVDPRPNDELPKDLAVVPGVVSLVADFEHPYSDGRVPVYLINATEKPLTLNAQDGDVYLKLEVANVDGTWTRAQPHAYSWCGNSYMFSPTIKPGQHLTIRGYQPAEGDKKKVRYALYEQSIQLVSNAGEGVVLREDVAKASSDAMAVKSGSFDFVKKVALREIVLENKMDHVKDLQQTAVWTLAEPRFEAEDSIPVLEEVARRFPEMKSQAEGLIRRLREGPEEEGKEHEGVLETVE